MPFANYPSISPNDTPSVSNLDVHGALCARTKVLLISVLSCCVVSYD